MLANIYIIRVLGVRTIQKRCNPKVEGLKYDGEIYDQRKYQYVRH